MDSNRKRDSQICEAQSPKRRRIEDGLPQSVSAGGPAGGPAVDEGSIPPPQPPPTPGTVPLLDYTYVTFDLETTDKGRYANIIQLSAVSGDREFDRYVVPRKPISLEASLVTDLSDEDGVLCYRGEPVDAVTIDECLKEFLVFLRGFERPVLVAHNGQLFDGPIFCHEAARVDLLDDFKAAVWGFLDTLKMFRKVRSDLRSHTQQSLSEAVLVENSTADTHNSLHDVNTLQRIVKRSLIPDNVKLEYVCPFEYIIQKAEHTRMKRETLDSLQPLVLTKHVSAGMAGKMAATGLALDHMVTAFSRHGADGVITLLTDPLDGKPRVTKSKSIISKIVSFFD